MVSREVPALVFVNRAAGHGRARTYLPRMRSLFASLHFPAQFVETGSADELESAARCALSRGQRTLLAMGGDGTFQALANGVYGSEAIIGILPTGGGNDLAAALGLRGNVFRVTQEVLKGKPRPVDLVSVRTADGRSRLYAGGGGVGLDAEAALLANGRYRRLPGRFRYIASALRAFWDHRPLTVQLEFPGAESCPVKANCLLAGVLSTPSYGAGLRLAPDALIDDGLLDLVLIADLRALAVLQTASAADGKWRTPHLKSEAVESEESENLHRQAESVSRRW